MHYFVQVLIINLMKKNNLLLFYISILGISTFISSCSPKFYAPTTAITPLFREKGEAQFSGHIGTGDVIDRSLQVQAACAIDSHLAIFGTFYTAQSNYHNNEPISVNAGKGSQIELAVGYFAPISSKVSYEIYGGFARGNVTNDYQKRYTSNTSGNKWFPQSISNNCFKSFVQGNIGYRSKYFDAVFNMRLGYLKIGGITETLPTIDTGYVGTPIEAVEKIKSNPNSFLIEPGLTLRVGYEPLKLQFHFGQSFSSNGSKYPIDGKNFSIGLAGMINSSTAKKKHH